MRCASTATGRCVACRRGKAGPSTAFPLLMAMIIAPHFIMSTVFLGMHNFFISTIQTQRCRLRPARKRHLYQVDLGTKGV